MSSADVPLLIFARAPTPGRAKTRLIPALGEAGAAELYAAFLEDVRATASRVPGLRPELWVAAEADAAAFPQARVQRGPDLGARMRHALADALSRAPSAVLVGSDAPTLPSETLAAAVRALGRADVVLGPATDGGYYLVGARGQAPALDGAIRWSTRHALADTVACLGDARVAMLRPHYDVDTPEDLRLLRLHLALRPEAAPVTARVLACFDRRAGA